MEVSGVCDLGGGREKKMMLLLRRSCLCPPQSLRSCGHCPRKGWVGSPGIRAGFGSLLSRAASRREGPAHRPGSGGKGRSGRWLPTGTSPRTPSYTRVLPLPPESLRFPALACDPRGWTLAQTSLHLSQKERYSFVCRKDLL